MGYLIDVRKTHDCISFDFVRISLKREKYWYQIRGELVPVLHALLRIVTKSSRREMYEE